MVTTEKQKKMGRFSVEFEIANNQDINDALKGRLDPAKVRRMTIRGVVDSGATRLVLPLGAWLAREKTEGQGPVRRWTAWAALRSGRGPFVPHGPRRGLQGRGRAKARHGVDWRDRA